MGRGRILRDWGKYSSASAIREERKQERKQMFKKPFPRKFGTRKKGKKYAVRERVTYIGRPRERDATKNGGLRNKGNRKTLQYGMKREGGDSFILGDRAWLIDGGARCVPLGLGTRGQVWGGANSANGGINIVSQNLNVTATNHLTEGGCRNEKDEKHEMRNF